MFLGPDLYGFFMLFTVFPAAYLIRLFWDHRNRPSGRWFVVTLVGMSGWAAFWGLLLLFDDYALSLVSFNLVLLFVNVSVVAWLFVAVEYVWQKTVALRTVLPFLVVPTVTQLLAWSNPMHELVWGPSTHLDTRGVLHVEYELGFYVHAVYAYMLVVASFVLLTIAYSERKGPYRKQTVLLIVGWLFPVSTSVLFVFGFVPTNYLNPSPLGFLAGASVWGWGIFRYRLLQTMPIARRTVLSEMSEGILIVNEQGIVSDANASLVRILDVEEDPTGERLDDVLDPYPELRLRLGDERVDDETISVRQNGTHRHLTINKHPVTHEGASAGCVIVVNDQTELLRYEEELELLKEVLARVLRHDIRNKLNVIRSHGELLQQQVETPHRQSARKIVRTSDEVINTAEKARVIESLVEADRQLYDIELVRVVEETTAWARETFPDANVDIDVPEEAWVQADEGLSLAVESLIENALVHNDSTPAAVEITVRADGDSTQLEILDNGLGLTRHERRIFEKRSIDQLNHSTGLGLWLVNWVVRNSDATIDIEAMDCGTRIVLRFDRGFRRPDPVSAVAGSKSDSAQ